MMTRLNVFEEGCKSVGMAKRAACLEKDTALFSVRAQNYKIE